MGKLLIITHFAACFLLIVVVLFQGSKSSAMGIFGGGGGGDALFSGASGTNFIKRFTIVLALTIATTSVLLTIQSSKKITESVVDKYAVEAASETKK